MYKQAERNIVQRMMNDSPWRLAGTMGATGLLAGILGTRFTHDRLRNIARAQGHHIPDHQRPTRALRWGLPATMATAAAIPALSYGILGNKRAHTKRADFVDFRDSMNTISRDPFMSPYEKDYFTNVFTQARRKAPDSRKDRLSSGDLIKGFVGAGLGGTAASIGGNVAGKLFGLPQGVRDSMTQVGTFAGALRGSGII